MNILGPGIDLFWTLYFLLSFLANLADYLKRLGKNTFRLVPSGNFTILQKIIDPQNNKQRTTKFTFFTIMGLELVSSMSLFAALPLVAFNALANIDLYFIVPLVFVCGLLLGNELFCSYESEGEHIALFIGLLVSVFAIYFFGSI